MEWRAIGEVVVGARGEEVPGIPPDWSPSVGSLLVVSNLVDRHSVGMAGLTFLAIKLRSIWGIHVGIFHDFWNAVRVVAKKACKGAVWSCVVKFSAVCNLGFTPFRSGAWRKKMQEVSIV